MSTLFQNAIIINPAEKLNRIGSIKISEHGVIEEVVFDEIIKETSADKVYDFKGKIIASGLLDMHVHFREPGFEYKETIETGAASAINGGFTAVALMPNTEPAIDNAMVVAFIQKKSERLPIDILPIGAITQGRKGEKISPYGELAEFGVRAISDDGSPVMNSQVMRLAFEYAAHFNLLLIQHCEDSCLSAGGVMNESQYSSILGLRGIPTISESIILSRDIALLQYLMEKKQLSFPHPLRYHVAHLSTKKGIELVREAKKNGLLVTAEVTPHHFTLTDKDVFEANYNGNFKMNPPLRSEEDRFAVLEAIQDGTIDCIATDHAPHALHEKDCGFNQAAFGIVGLETAIGLTFTQLVHTKKIDSYRAIEMLSTNPRKLLSAAPIHIKQGEIANLTLIDPNIEYLVEPNNLQSKSKNTPFITRKLQGKSIGIISKGKVIIHL